MVEERVVVEKNRKHHKRKKRRVVSGALLEEGDGQRLRGIRGGDRYDRYEKEEYRAEGGKGKKKLCGWNSEDSLL